MVTLQLQLIDVVRQPVEALLGLAQGVISMVKFFLLVLHVIDELLVHYRRTHLLKETTPTEHQVKGTL